MRIRREWAIRWPSLAAADRANGKKGEESGKAQLLALHDTATSLRFPISLLQDAGFAITLDVRVDRVDV